jgi:hypothetical protein
MGVLAEPARQGLGDGVGSQGVGEWGSGGVGESGNGGRFQSREDIAIAGTRQ